MQSTSSDKVSRTWVRRHTAVVPEDTRCSLSVPRLGVSLDPSLETSGQRN